ncbi:MAG: hypothetical protein R3B60_01820 [Candidatus Paceibacterota bacterium]
MSKHFLFPIFISLMALVFLNPGDILMPSMLTYTLLGLLVLGLTLYGVFIFKEQVRDEREVKVRSFAHQVGFFVSMTGLVTIIAWYLLTKNHVYPEIIILLVIVTLSKGLAYWYGDKNF